MGGNGLSQSLTQAGMGQDEIVIHLEQRQLLAQAVFTLTRRGAAPPDRRHSLTQAQIEPFDKRRIDLPAAGGQDLSHRRLRAEDDAMFDRHDPPPSHSLDHLSVEQRGQGHPAWFGRGACGLAPRRVHPAPEMRHNGGEIMRVPVAQKERHTPRRQQLRELMQYGLGHRQCAFTHLDAQEQLALGIERRPDPVGGTREPLDRLGYTHIALSHRANDGVEFVKLDLSDV